MSFFKKAKQAAILNRLQEEKLHELVFQEMETGIRKHGLWAQAIRKSRGNEQEAIAVYIGLRVQSIKDEDEIIETITQHRPAQNTTPPKELPKESLDVSLIHGSDRDVVLECSNLLSTYGFTLSGAKRKWKIERGTMTTYCYSFDELERTVKSFVKQEERRKNMG